MPSFTSHRGSNIGSNPIASPNLDYRHSYVPPTQKLTSTWTRNPNWLTLPTVLSTDEKLVGLYAVWPEPTFIAFTCAGNYTVDWGDGTTENVSSGVQANHQYDYTSASLANSNAPVTLTDSGDLITRNSHGYTDGMIVRFYNIVTTTGLNESSPYYVINSTTNTFQVSTTSGGSAVALTNDGSATLLPYKQAIVTITPQAGQNLTSVNLNKRNSTTNLNQYVSGWLDITLSGPNLSSSGLAFSGYYDTTLQRSYTEKVTILNLGNVTTFFSMFQDYSRLASISLPSTAKVTDMRFAFLGCSSLQTIPLIDTSNVDTMYNMFTSCSSLESVPLLNTSKVWNMWNMFAGCTSLKEVPRFNTPSLSTMKGMFYYCTSLKTIPLFDTKNVTDMDGTFESCRNLVSVPLLNTANVTTMVNIFYRASKLRTLPAFNTAKVTNMTNAFREALSLEEIPLLDTRNVTNMDGTFRDSYSFKSIPLFNTANVTSMSATFYNSRIESLPALNTAKVTTMQDAFGGASCLKSFPLLNTANVTTFWGAFSTTNIKYFPTLNTSKATSFYNMFSNSRTLEIPSPFDTANASSSNDLNNTYAISYIKRIPQYNTTKAKNVNTFISSNPYLKEVPPMNWANVTSATAFSPNQSMARMQAYNIGRTFSVATAMLSKNALEEIFVNLSANCSGNTITITSNYGVDSAKTKTANTTAQSNVVTIADTTNLSANMFVTGVGTGISGTGITVSSNVSTDILTFVNHGLPNNTAVSFSSLGTTTGIVRQSIYYVANSAADTFQISSTAGGSVIDLTGTDSSMNVSYPSYISSIITNTSVTLTTPAASTQTNTTLTFRNLNSSVAILKGWSVTY